MSVFSRHRQDTIRTFTTDTDPVERVTIKVRMKSGHTIRLRITDPDAIQDCIDYDDGLGTKEASADHSINGKWYPYMITMRIWTGMGLQISRHEHRDAS